MREFILGLIVGIVFAGLIFYFNFRPDKLNKEYLDQQVEDHVNAKMDSIRHLPIDSVINWIIEGSR